MDGGEAGVTGGEVVPVRPEGRTGGREVGPTYLPLSPFTHL